MLFCLGRLGRGRGAVAPDIGSLPKRGRVRAHGAPSRQAEGSTGSERRSALLDKGWVRRSVAVNGVAPSDHADFEAVAAAATLAGGSSVEPGTDDAALGGGSDVGDLQALGELQSLEDMPIEELMDLVP